MDTVLSAAVRSVPLVTVSTDDTLHAFDVLQYLTGLKPSSVVDFSGTVHISKNPARDAGILLARHIRQTVWANSFPVLWGDDLELPRFQQMDWDDYLAGWPGSSRALVVVNPDEPLPGAVDFGPLMPPPEMLTAIAHEFTGTNTNNVAGCLGGLTVMEALSVLRIAQQRNDDVQVADVKRVRSRIGHPHRGVQLIATEPDFYYPSAALARWSRTEGRVFNAAGIPDAIRPRGVLLHGEPGTGKTAGAMYIARRLEVPLFRLDVGATLSKWVGQSEAQLMAALHSVEHSEPCVLLVDEVEKLFQGNDDAGVTPKILAGLLWWLQEHQSRVLTVMTTNDQTKIPPELYRAGRIDAKLEVRPLDMGRALEFIREYMRVLAPPFDIEAAKKIIWENRYKLITPDEQEGIVGVSHTAAVLRELVNRYIRRNITGTLGEIIGGQDDE